MSLKANITLYMRGKYPEWVEGYKLAEIASNGQLWGKYTGETAARRCRDLAKAGILEKKEEGGYVKYRYLHLEEIIKEEKKLESPNMLFSYPPLQKNHARWRE